MCHLIFVRCNILLVAAVFASTLWPVASVDILSVYPSSINAGTPAQLQLQVDLSAFSIPKIAEVEVGDQHTCALTTSGALYCWGRGDVGQVGNGKNDGANNRPILVRSSGVASICAAGYHSCILSFDGAVFCFGWNVANQLGDGTALNRNIPVPVLGLQANVTAISCGDFHNCALNSSGNVLCWGYNAQGQLGDGSTTNRASPVPVLNLPPIKSIQLGIVSSCALASSTMHLYCWGSNNNGQIGNGVVGGEEHVKSPVQVIGMGSVLLFALGGTTTCASNLSGVFCWGANQAGQVGDGTSTQTPKALPTAVKPSHMGPVQALSLGDSFGCALDMADSLWCWGRINQSSIHYDVQGYRGNTDFNFFASLAEPVNASAAIVHLPWNARKLGCGNKNVCVVSINGTLICWGAQEFTSLTPSAVFVSSSSVVVLTVAGLGFGSAGGAVTLGRIGSVTNGLSFHCCF
jgi:alpha-tubulin suppressor-like RCC1 family protein